MALHDINDRSDVVRLVDAFYAKVRVDAFLAPVFVNLDWHNHVPTMYNFWCSMLLGEGSYQGNPLQRHMRLDITSRHFDEWLEIFDETVDELFEGTIAAEAKTRTRSIAAVFQHKMGLLKPPGHSTKS